MCDAEPLQGETVEQQVETEEVVEYRRKRERQACQESAIGLELFGFDLSARRVLHMKVGADLLPERRYVFACRHRPLVNITQWILQHIHPLERYSDAHDGNREPAPADTRSHQPEGEGSAAKQGERSQVRPHLKKLTHAHEHAEQRRWLQC